jgi:hypothetical protein
MSTGSSSPLLIFPLAQVLHIFPDETALWLEMTSDLALKPFNYLQFCGSSDLTSL